MIARAMGEGQQIRKLMSSSYANELAKLKWCVRADTLATCCVADRARRHGGYKRRSVKMKCHHIAHQHFLQAE